MKKLAAQKPAMPAAPAYDAVYAPLPAPYGGPPAFGQACCIRLDSAERGNMGGYHSVGPQAPVLSFLQHPAVVLTNVKADEQGSVHVPPQQLQQLMSSATASAGDAHARSNAADAVRGYSCVYFAVYVPHQPGQFCSARCVVQGAQTADQLVEPDSCRDLGLTRDVQEDDILALVGCFRTLALGKKCSTWGSAMMPANHTPANSSRVVLAVSTRYPDSENIVLT